MFYDEIQLLVLVYWSIWYDTHKHSLSVSLSLFVCVRLSNIIHLMIS
jgi:hypothetical protein